MARQQLPPQIKKIELARKVRGRPVVRYQLTVDIGADPTTGRASSTANGSTPRTKPAPNCPRSKARSPRALTCIPPRSPSPRS